MPRPKIIREDIDPASLLGFFKQHTDMQAQQLIAPFIGQWIKVTGTISDIAPVGFGRVSVFTEWPGRAQMVFSGECTERLYLMKKGDVITATGRIHEVRIRTVVLMDCELSS
jgi:hypothetical protein